MGKQTFINNILAKGSAEEVTNYCDLACTRKCANGKCNGRCDQCECHIAPIKYGEVIEANKEASAKKKIDALNGKIADAIEKFGAVSFRKAMHSAGLYCSINKVSAIFAEIKKDGNQVVVLDIIDRKEAIEDKKTEIAEILSLCGISADVVSDRPARKDRRVFISNKRNGRFY